MVDNKRIDELDSAAPLTGAELFPAYQSSETRKCLLSVLKDYVKDGLTTTDVAEGSRLYYTNDRADARVALHGDLTNNPHVVTKTQVGLGNVQNVLCNLAATSAPTTGDDSGDGYDVGSIWVNLTTDIIYVCSDSSLGAAVWKNVTNSGVTLADIGLSNVLNTKHNYSATSAPTANDDDGDGYSIGSVWVDTVDDESWICTDATTTAAVWALTTLDETTVRSAGSTTQYKIPYWDNAASQLNDGLLGTDGQFLKFTTGGQPTSSALPAADNSTAGVLETATDAEAQALSSTILIVTPANIAALLASQAEAEAGAIADRLMTPLQTAQAIAALAGGGGGTRYDFSAQADMDFPLSTTKCCLIHFFAKPANDAVNAFFQFSKDNRSSFLTANYELGAVGRLDTGTGSAGSSTSTSGILLNGDGYTIGNATKEGLIGTYFCVPNGTLFDFQPGIVGHSTVVNGSTATAYTGQGGCYNSTVANMNGGRIVMSAGNVSGFVVVQELA